MAQVNKTLEQNQYTENQNFDSVQFTNALSVETTPQVVVQSSNVMPQFTVERRYVEWSWGSLITAMISMLCCFGLGFIATVMAILSYVDHSSKEYERSKAKRRVAYCLGITAIVFGTIIVIITIAVLFSSTTVMIQNGYK